MTYLASSSWLRDDWKLFSQAGVLREEKEWIKLRSVFLGNTFVLQILSPSLEEADRMQAVIGF